MRYLFFDIECADGNFKICEFGYVITNEQFEILAKHNILINPQCQFNLTDREGQDDLILSYPYDEYYKHPTFEVMYDNIRSIMTWNDLLVFGHAVTNDISFLDKSCRYRKMPRFDYVAYDTQKILKAFSKTDKIPSSLDSAFTKLVPEDDRQGLINHRACDDAEKTMLVLKWMTKTLGFTVKEVLDSCPECKVHAFEHLEWKKENDRKRQLARAEKKALKEGQEAFNALVELYFGSQENENNIGKFVTVSKRLKQDKKALIEVISQIKDSSFIPVEKTLDSDLLVVADTEDAAFLKENMRHPYSGAILTAEEFAELVAKNKAS